MYMGAFEAIDTQAKPEGEEVVVYFYSAACMTGRKIGMMLTEHEIYVKHLVSAGKSGGITGAMESFW
jgi:hypothetical protein